MVEKRRLMASVAVLIASTVLAGFPAGATDLKLFATPDEVEASAAKPLPLALLQPLPSKSAASPRTALVPFEQSASAMRLVGEDASTVLTFSLSGQQKAAGGQLQLNYHNAVSVLPDNAVIDLEVNGKPAGSFAVRSPNGFTAQSVPVAADLLREGRNALRVRVREHHRVDCSLAASYELWTEIDPVTSGFVASAAGGFRDVPDLLSVGRGEGGVTDIHLVLPDAGAVKAANESLPLLQALALYLNRPDTVVSVSSEPGTGPGIDVYVGDAGDYSANVSAAGMMKRAAPGLSVMDGQRPGRAALILSGASDAQRQERLVAAVSGPMQAGFESGVRGVSFAHLVAKPSQTYTLKDVGYRTQPFAGRLSRVQFEMEMPADFYPAEYASIDFFLKGATAPGLYPGAQLLVRVNGQSVRSYPFRDVRGEEFDGKRMELPLRAFHPGVNQVEIIAELPVETDAACAPEARDDSHPRFIMLEESEIRVPGLARIGRLPDLAAFSGAAYPFDGGKPFDVVLDRSDNGTVAAAFTMLTRLAQSARAPLGGEIRFGQPQAENGRDALIFASGGSLQQAALTKGGRLTTTAQAGMTDPFTTASVATSAPPVAAADSRSLLDAFHSSTAVATGQSTLRDRVSDWLWQARDRFAQWLQYRNGDDTGEGKVGALVSLTQKRAPFGAATWTVVRADSPEMLEQGVAHLTSPAVWDRLQGGTASLGHGAQDLVTKPAEARYVYDLSDRSFFNLRRIVAAWFSDNFQIYIAVLIALLSGLALWLGRIVPRSGVRTDK